MSKYKITYYSHQTITYAFIDEFDVTDAAAWAALRDKIANGFYAERLPEFPVDPPSDVAVWFEAYEASDNHVGFAQVRELNDMFDTPIFPMWKVEDANGGVVIDV